LAGNQGDGGDSRPLKGSMAGQKGRRVGGGLGSTTSTWREEGVGVRPSTLGRRVAGSSPKPAGARGGGNKGKIKAGWRSHVDMRAPATVPGLIPVKPGQNHSNKIEFKF
jgi:hypothetical protein